MSGRIEINEICFRNFTTLNKSALLEILSWRNSEHIRSRMMETSEISAEEHLNFCASLKNRSDMRMYRVDCNGKPCGVLTIKKIDLIHHCAETGAYYIEGQNIPAKVTYHAAELYRSLGIKEVHSYIKKSNLQAVLFDLLKTNAVMTGEDDNFVYVKFTIGDKVQESSVKVRICEQA